MTRQRTCSIELENPPVGTVKIKPVWRLIFRCPYDPIFKDMLKGCPGARWDGDEKVWFVDWHGAGPTARSQILGYLSMGAQFIKAAQERQITVEWNDKLHDAGIVELGTGQHTIFTYVSQQNECDRFGWYGVKLHGVENLANYLAGKAYQSVQNKTQRQDIAAELEAETDPGVPTELDTQDDNSPLVGTYADPDTVMENKIIKPDIEPLFMNRAPTSLPEYMGHSGKVVGERILFTGQREFFGWYQRRVGSVAHERPGDNVGAIMAHDPGEGKMTTAIAVAEKFPAFDFGSVGPNAQPRAGFAEKYRAPIKRIVVVCPERARTQWQQEFELLTRRKAFRYGLDELAGKNWSETPNGVLIVGYASIIKESFVTGIGNPPFETDLLIIDEVHYMANNKSKRSVACRAISRRVTHTLGLSGTPMLAKPIELYPALNMIEEKRFSSYWKYATRYCNAHKGKFGWVVDGKSHVDELVGWLSQCMHRIRKSQAKGRAMRRMVVPIDIGDKSDMDDAVAAAMGDLTVHASAVNVAITADIRQIVYDARRDETIDWLADWARGSPGRKLLVFCWNKLVVEDVAGGLVGALDLPAGSVVTATGDNSQKQREASIKAFAEQGICRFMVATIGALGDSVNRLQEKCSTGVFVQCDWTPGTMLQAEARLDRTGQTDPVEWYYLVAADTVDERLVKALVKKQATVNQVIDGGKTSDSDNYSDVLQELLRWKASYDGRHSSRNRRPERGSRLAAELER